MTDTQIAQAQVHETFARNLFIIRNYRRMSQVELAKAAQLPASSISHFESGRRLPSCTNLRRLAFALEISADYLLGIKGAYHTTQLDHPTNTKGTGG
jgi:transcriptional regulator with XRE-family HTH domain